MTPTWHLQCRGTSAVSCHHRPCISFWVFTVTVHDHTDASPVAEMTGEAVVRQWSSGGAGQGRTESHWSARVALIGFIERCQGWANTSQPDTPCLNPHEQQRLQIQEGQTWLISASQEFDQEVMARATLINGVFFYEVSKWSRSMVTEFSNSDRPLQPHNRPKESMFLVCIT